MRSIIAFIFFIIISQNIVFAQAILKADGPELTYELITDVLAPGYNPIENPECIHPEFGRHIAEVYDSTLNEYVFEFYIHVTPDNDRCKYFDRQRVEIKTYDQSPDSLLGIEGEHVIYKWKFKLPEGFQPSSSFTHIHQIKAVGGDDGMPIFTLTPRKGTPDVMELIHNNTTKVRKIDLALFIGRWVECTEVIYLHPTNGSYSMTIKDLIDGDTILEYSNDSLMTIRPDNDFIRPKWGIYRSLNKAYQLRDEAVRFNDFSIQEINVTNISEERSKLPNRFSLEQNYPNPFNPTTVISYSIPQSSNVSIKIFDLLGREIETLISKKQSQGYYSINFDATDIPSGTYFYRIKAGNFVETKKMMLLK